MKLILLALVPACFALNPITGKVMVAAFGPATLSIIRWLFSAVIVAAIALPRAAERWRAPVRHVLWIAVLGGLAMGFCAYAAFEASRTTEATNIALIYGCTSALVAAWEIAAGRQRAGVALLVGVIACLMGVVLLITRGEPFVLFGLTFTPGDVWAAAGMGVFVFYTIALRRTPALLTPMPQFVVMGLAASLGLSPLAAQEIAAGGLPPIGYETLPWLVVLVLLTGIGAFLGYNLSLARNGPVLTAASLTLTPAYAAGLATLLIGEELAWYHAAAIALVIAGLLLINRGQTRNRM